MTEPLIWETGKFLKWRTHLPYEYRPVTSPVFLIKNTDCYFHLSRRFDKYYYLYLIPKSATTKLETFSLSIFYNFPESSFCQYFYTCRRDFKDSQPIFSLDESNFSIRTSDLSRGFSVTFIITVDENVELPNLSENETGKDYFTLHLFQK